MNRLSIWCPLTKGRDRCQTPLWSDARTSLLNPQWHLPLQCRPRVEHRLPAGPWRLPATWWQCLAAKYSSCLCARVRDRRWFLPKRWEQCQWYGTKQSLCQDFFFFWWIRIQHHNVDNGTTFRRCLHATSHEIKPMHMHKWIRTVNQTQCCFMLVFHKLTVPLQAPFRPRAHTQTNCGKPSSISAITTLCVQPPACLSGLLCVRMCMFVCVLTLVWRKKRKRLVLLLICQKEVTQIQRPPGGSEWRQSWNSIGHRLVDRK